MNVMIGLTPGLWGQEEIPALFFTRVRARDRVLRIF